eukprot:6207040-Pleurochrysis_carterae.AAC.2
MISKWRCNEELSNSPTYLRIAGCSYHELMMLVKISVVMAFVVQSGLRAATTQRAYAAVAATSEGSEAALHGARTSLTGKKLAACQTTG